MIVDIRDRKTGHEIVQTQNNNNKSHWVNIDLNWNELAQKTYILPSYSQYEHMINTCVMSWFQCILKVTLKAKPWTGKHYNVFELQLKLFTK